MELTPTLIQNSVLIMIISYFVAFIFQIYMMYLNYKQSKVNNQMEMLIGEVRGIKELLGDKKSEPKARPSQKK